MKNCKTRNKQAQLISQIEKPGNKTVQLNEYETAPYFIQLSQKLTYDCLLISVFSPEFT